LHTLHVRGSMPKSIGSQSPPAFRILILDEYTEATRQMTRDAEIGDLITRSPNLTFFV
jgi:hypothetical protein